MLQEFVDARRRAIQNAPQVLFRNEPPLELQNVPGLADSSKGEVGYVTFGIMRPELAIFDRKLTIDSPLSSPPHRPTAPRKYLPHPDVQRLFPLPH